MASTPSYDSNNAIKAREALDTDTAAWERGGLTAKLVRLGCGLSQRDFGALLDMSQEQVSRLERQVYLMDDQRALLRKVYHEYTAERPVNPFETDMLTNIEYNDLLDKANKWDALVGFMEQIEHGQK